MRLALPVEPGPDGHVMDQLSISGQLAGGIIRMALRLPGGRRALQRLLLRHNAWLFRALLWPSRPDPQDASLDSVALQDLFGPAHEALYQQLAADDFALLRQMVRQTDGLALRALLADDTTTLHAWLAADGHRRFREAAMADHAALLSAILRNEGATVLKKLLAASDFALFRTVAQASDSEPLKAVLFDNDYEVLKRLLALKGHEALKAVVLDGDPACFPLLARARGGQPLADLLFENDGELLRRVLQLAGDGALRPLLEKDGRRYVRALPDAMKDELAGDLLRDGARPSPDVLDRAPDLLEAALASPRAEAMQALAKKWRALDRILPRQRPDMNARYHHGMRHITAPEHVRGRVLDAITEGDIVHLAGGSLQFPDRHSLWTQIHEILLNEDYYFACESDAPRIIDGGAHMGMAVYYFKSLYPEAHITAFEPNPSLRAMLESNIARNNFRDVTVLPCALAGEETTATFHISEQWSMAGSLSDFRGQHAGAASAVEVDCVPLSTYLDRPVDFLKLDIEGAEAEVLEEAAPKLGNVRHLFCEYHQGAGLPSGRLARILGILDAAGFEVQVAKSHNFQDTSRTRPLEHFDNAASMVIWGRNRG